MSSYWESYRQYIEEGKERTPEQLAIFVKQQLHSDRRFYYFQENLRLARNSKRKDDETLQIELEEFLEFKIDHDEIFDNKTSKLEQWRKLRKLYSKPLMMEENLGYVDGSKNQWLHNPKLTLYLRNELSVTPE